QARAACLMKARRVLHLPLPWEGRLMLTQPTRVVWLVRSGPGRRGPATHHQSSGLEAGLEATPQVAARLELMQERQLGDYHCAPDIALRRDQARCRDWARAIEDGLELAVEVLDGARTQRMEDAAHRDAVIGVGVGPAPRRDQRALMLDAVPADRGVVVG